MTTYIDKIVEYAIHTDYTSQGASIQQRWVHSDTEAVIFQSNEAFGSIVIVLVAYIR